MESSERPHNQQMGEYRRKGAEAAACAASAGDGRVRQYWQNIAAWYDGLADGLEYIRKS